MRILHPNATNLPVPFHCCSLPPVPEQVAFNDPRFIYWGQIQGLVVSLVAGEEIAQSDLATQGMTALCDQFKPEPNSIRKHNCLYSVLNQWITGWPNNRTLEITKQNTIISDADLRKVIHSAGPANRQDGVEGLPELNEYEQKLAPRDPEQAQFTPTGRLNWRKRIVPSSIRGLRRVKMVTSDNGFGKQLQP